MKKLMFYLMLSALMALAGNAMADNVVAIVNKANTSANKATIDKLYQNKIKTWPNGDLAQLYDLASQSERDAFCNTYTGKDSGAIKSIWAQAVFAGRGIPPRVLDSDAAVIQKVANNKDAVGYVKASSVNSSVKVVK